MGGAWLRAPLQDEEELHHFRCSHADRTGHLVLTPAHVAFLAYDQSTMFSVPIEAILRLRAARSLTWAAASDNSLILTLSNGRRVQFDGFWERDECIALLHACGRYLKHTITVEEASEEAPAPATSAPGVGGPASHAASADAAAGTSVASPTEESTRVQVGGDAAAAAAAAATRCSDGESRAPEVDVQ